MQRTACAGSPPWLTIITVSALVLGAGYSTFCSSGTTADIATRIKASPLVELVPGKAETIHLTRADAAQLLGLVIIQVRPTFGAGNPSDLAALPQDPPRGWRIRATFASNRKTADIVPSTGLLDSARGRNSIAIPTTALIEDGHSVSVFVARDGQSQEFRRIPVTVLHARAGIVHIDSRPATDDGAGPIRFGDQIIASGAVALAGEMTNLRLNRPHAD